MKINLTQESFDNLVNGLNHRMTTIEHDVKWIKGIGYYMAGAVTAIMVKLLFL